MEPVRLLASAASALLLAALPAGGGADATLERARELERARDWPALVELLGERGKRAELAADEHRILGAALAELGRADEAAHEAEAAALAFERAGRDAEAKAALAAVRRLDPLSARRDAFLRKAAASLVSAGEDLLEGGDAERALELAQRLPRIARGKDAQRAAALLEKARAAFEKVDLTAGTSAQDAPAGERSLIERESEHYRVVGELEPTVAERLGRVMDDLYAYYVRIYFDGDEKKARGARATIRVMPSKERMLEHWGGGGSPEGWWSPGTNEVYCYDTRAAAKSLDPMLETLYHEASHQFTTLLTGGGFVPAWLNEGTASFFEGAVAMADGRVLWPRAAQGRLDDLARQLGAPGGLQLTDVIGYESAASYAPEYYPWGWGLVYFLQEYEDPATLERPYRPLYARYRTEVVQRGGGSLATFERVLLGKDSPLHHRDLAAFERDWRRWILEEVVPLHQRNAAAREKRLGRADRLLAAAAALSGATNRKDKEAAADLLERALVHLEWVRAQIDREKPDGEVVLLQADALERLGRRSSAAALIEEALDLVEAGRFAPGEERVAALEDRLRKLDRKNAALRTARLRTAELTRAAQGLVDDYGASPLALRAYTCAADLAAVLGGPLVERAAELRARARGLGLLRGSIRALAAPPDAWLPILAAATETFEPRPGAIEIGCVRAGALVDSTVPVEGEYELRARFEPRGAREMGSGFGFVVAGAPESAATIVGIEDRGHVGIWTINAAPKNAATLRRVRTIGLVPPLPAEAPVELAVRVRADGRVEVRAADRPPVDARLEGAPLGVRYTGVFAKNADVRVLDALVELVP